MGQEGWKGRGKQEGEKEDVGNGWNEGRRGGGEIVRKTGMEIWKKVKESMGW